MSATHTPITEEAVHIRTPEGVCDAAFLHPAAGTWPAVIVWPDAFGLRPAMLEIGKRLAAEGYCVLIPNPFYRAPSPPITDAAHFDFGNPEHMAKLRPLMQSATAPGHAETDSAAFAAFLDTRPEVDHSKKMGTQGYCMGGQLALRTAAALPDRIGAAASFHGGGLVSDKPDSPHLLAPRIKARVYIGIASNDDARQPNAKEKLCDAFPDAQVEVYGSLHGWCVPDMPPRDGRPVYDKTDAEIAWGKLVALYRDALS